MCASCFAVGIGLGFYRFARDCVRPIELLSCSELGLGSILSYLEHTISAFQGETLYQCLALLKVIGSRNSDLLESPSYELRTAPR
jgi:hypothetical protein